MVQELNMVRRLLYETVTWVLKYGKKNRVKGNGQSVKYDKKTIV